MIKIVSIFSVLSCVALAGRHQRAVIAKPRRLLSDQPNTQSTWVLMVRQTKGFWFTPTIAASGKYNTNNPSSPNYCDLANLEQHRMNNVFTLKLTWPGLSDQIWKQSSNPFTTKKGGVAGYVPVAVPYTEFWGGLEWNGKEAILDGTPLHPYFFYEVGAFVPFQGGIAGPLKVVDKMELWVMSNRVTTTTSTTTTSTRPPNNPVTTTRRASGPLGGKPSSAWPCRVLSEKICESAPRCVFVKSHTECRCRDLNADFIFALDSSHQVGRDGFQYEKSLVTTMMLNLPDNSRVGVITSDMKGDATHTPKMAVKLQSYSAQSRMAVHTIEFANGHLSVHRVVETAMTAFESESKDRKMKRLVLFVGGVDMGTTDPCTMQSRVTAAGVRVIVIGVGDRFEASKIRCLVGDNSAISPWIIKVKMLNENEFSKAWDAINSLLCPRVLTE